MSLRRITPLAGFGQRHDRVGAEGQSLLLASEAVVEPPQFGPVRTNEEVKTIEVGELLVALRRLCVTDTNVGEHVLVSCWYRGADAYSIPTPIPADVPPANG